jgi:hypothetical protein
MRAYILTETEYQALFNRFGRPHTDYKDWNGREFNLIETRTICKFGFFPSLPKED